MLPLTVIEEAQRLLSEGELSQREIAARLGVSRGTVNAMANGRRGLHGRETDSPEVGLAFRGTPERCPGCRALVYMPCILCRTREYLALREEVAAVGKVNNHQKRVA